jgi:ABC-type transport system involved in cytochrome c biogenesis permease subunit
MVSIPVENKFEVVDQRVQLSFGEVVREIFAPLASLRLTVILFAMGAFIVLAGTFAQVELGIWDVMKSYFRSYIVWIPLKVFFPPNWFPALTNISGGFWFPGGRAIGMALLVNIIAAHLLRFKIQGKGARLWGGLAIIAFGSLVTFLVIMYGNWKGGVQDKPMFDFRIVWYMMLFGTLLLFIYSLISAIYAFIEKRYLEAILLAVGIVFSGAVLTWVLVTGKSLDTSALRIVWNLVQGSIASLIMLVGCMLVFKRRAGIVLLHAGVILLMVNELWIGSTAVEEQITVQESFTTNVARDIRYVELTVTDRSDEKIDRVIAIPQSRLRKDHLISDPLLPFEIRVEQFFRNSIVDDLPQGEKPHAIDLDMRKEEIAVTQGIGLRGRTMETPQVGGAKAGDEMDLASAYVSLVPLKKEGAEDRKPIATVLLSQHFQEPNTTMPDDGKLSEKVNFDGKTYELSLHFKRSYKPYQVKLEDVEKVDYVGTNTPKSYWSKFEIIDGAKHQAAKIKMNDPLRYKGETFYQSGYRAGPIETTTFQVVTNAGWMIPYVACMIVGFGMLAQFSTVLLRFLNRMNKELFLETEIKEKPIMAQMAADLPQPAPRKSISNMLAWVIPLTIVPLIAIALLAGSFPRSTPDGEIAFEQLGRIPIAEGGRVMPLDSYARLALETISQRQEIKYIDPDYEQHKASGKEPAEGDLIDWKTHSATEWLMDVIARRPGIDDVRVFRIYDPSIHSMLLLERRSGYRYSFNEISAHRDKLQKALDELRKSSEEKAEAKSVTDRQKQFYEEALTDLGKKYRTYNHIRMISARAETLREDYQRDLAFEPDQEERSRAPSDKELLLEFARQGVLQHKVMHEVELPLFIPAPSTQAATAELTKSDRSWETMTSANARNAIIKAAREQKITTASAWADLLWKDKFVSTETEVEHRLMVTMLPMIAQMIRQVNPDVTDEELIQQTSMMFENRDSIPVFQSAPVFRMAEEKARMDVQREQIEYRQAVAAFLGSDEMPQQEFTTAIELGNLVAAYAKGDPAEVNQSAAKYLEHVETMQANGYSKHKARAEFFYNALSPLYQSSVIYVFGFIFAACGWIFWTKGFNRISFFLILIGFLIHSFAIYERIIISGRPPVTNLYSSAVFISWATVLIGLVIQALFRIGIGNVLASLSGFVGLLIAVNLAVGQDTFKVVVAVLDTQFWLATHVVCITLGYGTTYVAGILGMIYIVRGVLIPTFRSDDIKVVPRIIYGITCFAIFFSFVGTVLGGLWADDSWGRFWGWDPKENGALIIVIWNALVLHARWGGMVRERGLAVLSVFGCIVTTWSWFGVNQLGIGLHSYGFTQGVLLAMGCAFVFFTGIILLGIIPERFWLSRLLNFSKR